MQLNLKKWKLVRNITLGILFAFILGVVFLGLGFAMDDGIYPDHFTGLSRLEAFAASASFISIVLAIPLILSTVALIISVMKIHQLRK